MLLSLPFPATAAVRRAEQKVPGEYIVVLKSGIDSQEAANRLAARFDGEIITTYDVVAGFAVRLSPSQAERLSEHPDVAVVEENAVATLAASTIVGPPEYPSLNLWHLDRIDQLTVGSPRLDNSYNYVRTGAGVRIYVVDGGVRADHPEFQGRVDVAQDLTNVMNAAGLGFLKKCWEQPNPSFDPNSSHGTAVASVTAGKSFGVARQATVVDARAFECNGFSSAARINKVLEWIINDPNRCASGSCNPATGTGTYHPGVVNMSFSFSKYDQGMSTTNQWIQTLVQTHNIKVVSAAGNISCLDAPGDPVQGCQNWGTPNDSLFFTPANSPYGITVAGSAHSADTHWSGSNYRAHFYAPAQKVPSASTSYGPTIGRWVVRSELFGCQDATMYWDQCTSGTSFAAPVVTGLVARYLQANPNATRSGVVAHLNSESLLTIGYFDGFSNYVAPLVNVTD